MYGQERKKDVKLIQIVMSYKLLITNAAETLETNRQDLNRPKIFANPSLDLGKLFSVQSAKLLIIIEIPQRFFIHLHFCIHLLQEISWFSFILPGDITFDPS